MAGRSMPDAFLAGLFGAAILSILVTLWLWSTVASLTTFYSLGEAGDLEYTISPHRHTKIRRMGCGVLLAFPLGAAAIELLASGEGGSQIEAAVLGVLVGAMLVLLLRPINARREIESDWFPLPAYTKWSRFIGTFRAPLRVYEGASAEISIRIHRRLLVNEPAHRKYRFDVDTIAQRAVIELDEVEPSLGNPYDATAIQCELVIPGARIGGTAVEVIRLWDLPAEGRWLVHFDSAGTLRGEIRARAQNETGLRFAGRAPFEIQVNKLDGLSRTQVTALTVLSAVMTIVLGILTLVWGAG